MPAVNTSNNETIAELGSVFVENIAESSSQADNVRDTNPDTDAVPAFETVFINIILAMLEVIFARRNLCVVRAD